MVRVFSFTFRNLKTGRLYFRVAVPKHLRPAFGRAEIKKSLGTADKSVAIPQAMRLYADCQQYFKLIEGGEMTKKKSDDDCSNIRIAPMDELCSASKALEALESMPDVPEGSHGLITIPTTGADGKPADIVIDFNGDAEKETKAAVALMNLSGPSPGSQSQKIAPSSPKAGESAKLADVCREYREVKSRGNTWRPKTAEEHEASHDLLLQYFRNVEIATITRKQARSFRDTLCQLPPNHTKGRFAGKKIRQIISMKPEKTLSPKTVNDNYIQRYSSLFDWAVQEELCATNPFAGLKIPIKRRAIEDREPFTDDDLRTIFDDKTFSLAKLKDAWKYWVPMIALYSGCRVNEIAQLRVEDIIEESGFYALEIGSEPDSVKTISSQRKVPVHPALIKLGLMSYVDSAKNNGDNRLFPDLYRVKRIKPGDKVSRWFNVTYLKRCGLRPTKRKISFHSLRHSFVDCLKKQGVQETKAAQIIGHTHTPLTYGTYGSEHYLKDLYDVVCRVQFPINEP